MNFLKLLGKKLKDFEVVELLENNDMEVIYHFAPKPLIDVIESNLRLKS